MVSLRGRWGDLSRYRAPAIAALTLLIAAYLGRQPRLLYLVLPVGGVAGVLLLWRPVVGLGLLVVLSLVIPRQFATGSEVTLNAATFLVPGLVALWLADMLRRGALRLAPSPVSRPLLLFLLSGAVSLVAGNALWDPTVPRPVDMTVVQIAQWAILGFSAAAFWLMANLVGSEQTLRRLTWLFLGVGGALAVLRVLPGGNATVVRLATASVTRSPFWMLLAALGAGQLLFNRELTGFQRGYLALVLGVVLYYAFILERSVVSTWLSITTATGLLCWLRCSRLRVPLVAIVLLASPFLLPHVFEFGGGQAEWEESGGSRLVLIERVVRVTMRNPITGLGPASYRPYAKVQPLSYLGAYWVNPSVNSHNNYVDLFAHGGLVGLGLFVWFAWQVGALGLRLRSRAGEGFTRGYVHGALAAGAASLVLMMLADWILPFVYNIGFAGFQASVLVWLFLGGLVAVAQWAGSGETL